MSFYCKNAIIAGIRINIDSSKNIFLSPFIIART
jgi:hypothetical protein